jgi:hypothetical protein
MGLGFEEGERLEVRTKGEVWGKSRRAHVKAWDTASRPAV